MTLANTNPFTRDEALALDARALDRALALPAPTAFVGEENDPMRRVEVRNGVGIVRVEGTLANDRWWCASYQDVVAEVGAALASPQVRAVVLSLDSPGGTTSGLFDTMRKLRALKAQHGKRVCAWVASQATSAAYGIASTCDEIVLDEMAGVGSIGCIAALMSRVGQLEQEGVDVRVVASGGEKTDGHPAVPITDAAVGRLRERVTMAAELLFAEVAAGRPSLPVEQQKALDAGIRYGRQAVVAGLADRVGTLDALLASLAPPNPYTAPRTGATATAPTRMDMLNEKLAALIAAKTGESDPERQYGALQALLDKADKHDELSAKLAKIELDAETETFERALKAGLDAKKISDEEAVWWREERAAGRATAKSLDANLSRRARPTLPAADPTHLGARPPMGENTAPATDPRLAGLLAKPYAALTWDERNLLAALAPETFDRLNAAWVAAGRPRG